MELVLPKGQGKMMRPKKYFTELPKFLSNQVSNKKHTQVIPCIN